MKIISGGQTGVDRAGLDEALSLGLEVGGYCPRDRKAEDGEIDKKYGLKEMSSRSYETRTRMNILKSDMTLILFTPPMTPGTTLTDTLCRILHKPFTTVDLNDLSDEVYEQVRSDIKDIEVLNVAGPRETARPGIYNKAREFMRKLLEDS